MSTLVAGVFDNSKNAGEAVSTLKQKSYTDSISLVAKDTDGEVNNHQVKESMPPKLLMFSILGGSLGALIGMYAGSFVSPAPGTWQVMAGTSSFLAGVQGSALGALFGGLIGSLLQLTSFKKQLQRFERFVLNDEVLVAVSGRNDRSRAIYRNLHKMGAQRVMRLSAI